MLKRATSPQIRRMLALCAETLGILGKTHKTEETFPQIEVSQLAGKDLVLALLPCNASGRASWPVRRLGRFGGLTTRANTAVISEKSGGRRT